MKRLEWPIEPPVFRTPYLNENFVVLEELGFIYDQLRAESMRIQMKSWDIIYSLPHVRQLNIIFPMYMEQIITVAKLEREAKSLREMAALIARRVNVLPRGHNEKAS
jgi:hypothetical protein